MGASLGGLTALLAGLHAAREVGAVFSQSGSFFQVGHDDRHESVTAFPHYWRITQRVQAVLDTAAHRPAAADRPDLRALEENAPNNASMAAALAPGRAPGRPTSRCRTCTTTPPGATRSTRTSPMSCEDCWRTTRMRPCSAQRVELPGARDGPPSRRDPPRPLGPAGAGLPQRGGPGRGLRRPRHGRRGAAPGRRGPGQLLLRRLARRVVLVGRERPDRGARPPARVVPGLAGAVGGRRGSPSRSAPATS